MGRSPCCVKEGMNRGAWTAAEDRILTEYIKAHGEGRWRTIPKKAGLKRCGKSCRLRWLNYLRPDIKRGNISRDEEELIIRLHKLLGNRWSLIAGRLPGRTDNEIKNYWNTNLCKKVHSDNHQHNRNHNKSSSPTHEQRRRQHLATHTDNKEPDPEASPPAAVPAPHVIKTKAMRCSKFMISSQKASNAENTNTTTGAVLMDNSAIIMESSSPDSDNNINVSLLSENFPGDFTLDLDVADVCFSELLNSDFAASSHELSNYENNNDHISFDFPEDYWMAGNYVQPNVNANCLNGFASFLESGEDWLL